MAKEHLRTRTVDVGQGRIVELRDSGVQPMYVDSLCETGKLNGTIHLSLGALINDSGNEMLIDVICRLRMNVSTARNLHAFLGQVIEDAAKPEVATTRNKKAN